MSKGLEGRDIIKGCVFGQFRSSYLIVVMFHALQLAARVTGRSLRVVVGRKDCRLGIVKGRIGHR